MSRFLILHGWENQRPVGHWQFWLAGRLRAAGHDVDYPQLPEPDRPVLKDWLGAIEQAITREPGQGLAVVAHSLSCVAWLHLAAQGSVHLPVDRVLLVAPPSPEFLARTEALRHFAPPMAALDAVRASSAAPPRLVCADADPYCEPPADERYAGLFDVDRIDGAGHVDMVAGYGRWHSALRWCEDPEHRLGVD
ncbi:RBBP9/YdeN family alpha/beta hydrolase [Dactylosporangium sp. CS-033363]|uniref:RBBP9/YdeN family alpha/beta hydrolase n=1 Tax=Dactylosporangium sp. CS-033363 TaxID=3239935 RepID=UPI003D924413